MVTDSSAKRWTCRKDNGHADSNKGSNEEHSLFSYATVLLTVNVCKKRLSQKKDWIENSGVYEHYVFKMLHTQKMHWKRYRSLQEYCDVLAMLKSLKKVCQAIRKKVKLTVDLDDENDVLILLRSFWILSEFIVQYLIF